MWQWYVGGNRRCRYLCVLENQVWSLPTSQVQKHIAKLESKSKYWVHDDGLSISSQPLKIDCKKKNSHIKLNDSRSDLFHSSYKIFVCLVAQSCSTPCSPTDCSLPDSSVHGDSPSMNTEVGCHAPLLRIFPTQGSNPGLLHCRQILYCLNHQGSPIKVISKWYF